uniref:seed leukoagglutinin-like n=1 Tax=Erigeron canadensis TaxID=72917 RepID=UPI001CB94571|nr:seed leukoagglutinin-like [Erigeron canadensis]
MGSVESSNGSLLITPANGQENQIGRLLYKIPVIAWPASFVTIFTIRIVVDPQSKMSGDGMAFVIAQDDQPSPQLSYGSYMGILGPSAQCGIPRQLAVELDTYKNEFVGTGQGKESRKFRD